MSWFSFEPCFQPLGIFARKELRHKNLESKWLRFAVTTTQDLFPPVRFLIQRRYRRESANYFVLKLFTPMLKLNMFILITVQSANYFLFYWGNGHLKGYHRFWPKQKYIYMRGRRAINRKEMKWKIKQTNKEEKKNSGKNDWKDVGVYNHDTPPMKILKDPSLFLQVSSWTPGARVQRTSRRKKRCNDVWDKGWQIWRTAETKFR